MRFRVDRERAYWRVLEGEAVVISAETSHYYSLNRTGTFVWNLLAEQALTPDEVVARVAARYERPEAQVSGDIRRLLDELAGEGLLAAE